MRTDCFTASSQCLRGTDEAQTGSFFPLPSLQQGLPALESGQSEAQAQQCHEPCGSRDAIWDVAAAQFGEAPLANLEHIPEKGAWQ